MQGGSIPYVGKTKMFASARTNKKYTNVKLDKEIGKRVQ